MATATGITIIKEMPYRAETNEEFSNQYWFKAVPPGDSASWTVLMNDVVAEEKKIYPASVKFVRCYGYDSNDPAANHVFFHDFTTPGPAPPGTFPPPAGATLMAGDQAALVRWTTDAKSSKGKTIYLYKYHHHGFINTANGDALEGGTYQPALSGYLTAMNAIHGGLRSQARDLNVTAGVAEPYVTTRTLKHRGKRGGPVSRAGSA